MNLMMEKGKLRHSKGLDNRGTGGRRGVGLGY